MRRKSAGTDAVKVPLPAGVSVIGPLAKIENPREIIYDAVPFGQPVVVRVRGDCQ